MGVTRTEKLRSPRLKLIFRWSLQAWMPCHLQLKKWWWWWWANLHLQLKKFDVFNDLFKHGCLVSLHRINAGFRNWCTMVDCSLTRNSRRGCNRVPCWSLERAPVSSSVETFFWQKKTFIHLNLQHGMDFVTFNFDYFFPSSFYYFITLPSAFLYISAWNVLGITSNGLTSCIIL